MSLQHMYDNEKFALLSTGSTVLPATLFKIYTLLLLHLLRPQWFRVPRTWRKGRLSPRTSSIPPQGERPVVVAVIVSVTFGRFQSVSDIIPRRENENELVEEDIAKKQYIVRHTTSTEQAVSFSWEG